MAKKNNISQKSAKQTQMAFFGLLLVGLFVGGYFGGQALGWWGASTAPEAYTTFDFTVYDIKGDLSTEFDDDDHDINIYKCDITGMDADEIEDLTYSDYTLDTSKDSGESYTPEDDEIYYAKMNGSDICEYWFIPQLGPNVLYATNMTEDVAMVAYSSDELSTTVNQTNYDKWKIQTQTLDGAEGTGVATSNEGFMSYYDFEDDEWQTFIIRVEFNATTALLAWCDFETTGYEVSESAAGSYIYYEIQCGIFGEDSFEIDLGSGLGSDFEAIGISVCYGTAASLTVWDSQN